MNCSNLLRGFGLLILWLAVLGGSILVRGPAGNFGRVLSDTELNQAFGDGTDPCKKSYSCLIGFTSGSSNCSYCNCSTSRWVCCNMGSGTTCAYTGSGACVGAPNMVGPLFGAAGSCSTCTASAYVQNGTCTGVLDAVGDNCAVGPNLGGG